MEELEKPYLVALCSINGIGPSTARRVVTIRQKLGLSWPQTWKKIVRQPAAFKLTEKQQQATQIFQQKYSPATYLDLLQAQKIEAVSQFDANYPKLLLEISDAPLVLFVKGTLTSLNLPAISVVGTRHITSYGEYVTKKIVQELVGADFTIVSGFMYGVDVMAHVTAEKAGGKTIGVLGFGFDHMYPAHQQSLFESLLEQGHTFVTEYPPFVSPQPGNFPARNRLVAGLSLGVLVTEAAAESGSHITATCAAEYGRSVYAVPGPITNPFCEGTKALLNQGAMCVSSGQEIAADLKHELQPWHRNDTLLPSELGDTAQQLLTQVATHAQTANELAITLDLPMPEILISLSYLELSGLVSSQKGRWGPS